MSYKALYRKYRPDSFEEMIGQDHVVTTLRNEIRSDRVGHAYLFTGTRGTGKTSAAKIFAKAVNCEDPVEGSPCGKCPTCRMIAEGSAMNVMEIDAASNNGVDNIRQIREETAYSPAQGKYKVYIIDEVHMLSLAAFNALLKILEEPPSYVIFILATTDVQKIPVTILSRCQRFDFHRIPQEEITHRLEKLLETEQVKAEEKALRYIARKAEGGMRDALSLTDQCISFYLGQDLTYDRVLELLGAVDTERLDRLYRGISSGDVKDTFRQLDEMLTEGRDAMMIVSDLTEHVRNILLIQTAPDAEDMVDASEEHLLLLKEDAQHVSGAALMRFIRILSETASSMRYAVNKRIVLETALVRLSRPQMETDLGSLTERLRVLEQKLENGEFVRTVSGDGNSGAGSRHTADVKLHTDADTAGSNIPYEKAVPEDLQRVRNEWNSIIGELEDKAPRFALADVDLQFDPNGAREGEIYVMPRKLGAGKFAQDAVVTRALEQIIEDRLQKKIAVHLLSDRESGNGGRQTIDAARAVDEAAARWINMEIEQE